MNRYAPHRSTYDILVVEPDQADARCFREQLDGIDAVNSVAIVSDGNAALDFVSRCGEFTDASVPNLILLELDLPEERGYEVLSELNAMPDPCPIPIIVMSNTDSPERVSRSYEYNANAHISKPTTEAEFERLVQLLETFWFDMAQLPHFAQN